MTAVIKRLAATLEASACEGERTAIDPEKLPLFVTMPVRYGRKGPRALGLVSPVLHKHLTGAE